MTTESMTEVVLVSATWCKRCNELKPEIRNLCAAVGVKFSILDYDDLEEEDPVKLSVKALPTIRMRPSGRAEWIIYRPTEIEGWRAAMTALPVSTSGEDF